MISNVAIIASSIGWNFVTNPYVIGTTGVLLASKGFNIPVVSTVNDIAQSGLEKSGNYLLDNAAIPLVNYTVSTGVSVATRASKSIVVMAWNAFKNELPSRNDTVTAGMALLGGIKEELPTKTQALETLRVPIAFMLEGTRDVLTLVGNETLSVLPSKNQTIETLKVPIVFLLEGTKDVLTLVGNETLNVLPSKEQVVNATREGAHSLLGTGSESVSVVFKEVRDAVLPSAEGMTSFFSAKPRVGTKGLETLAFEQYQKISDWIKTVEMPVIASDWIAPIEMPSIKATVITGLVAAAACYAAYRYKNSIKKAEAVAVRVITPERLSTAAAIELPAANKVDDKAAVQSGTNVSKDGAGDLELTQKTTVLPASTSVSKSQLASASMPELIPVDGVISPELAIISAT